MKPTSFFLLSLVAIFIGTLAALAVAGYYAKGQVNASVDAANKTPVGKLLGLLG